MVSNPQSRTIIKAMLTLDERMQAVCASVDPELFFMETGESATEPKSVCMGCPLRAAQLGGNDRCLEVAMANNEHYGVWAGLSTPERERLRAQRKKAAA
jgi:hypothetical protein